MELTVMVQKRFYRNASHLLVLLLAVMILTPLYPGVAQGYQGFGASTAGGEGQAVYHVTTLEDYNPTTVPPEPPILGSLRHALLQGNRRIVFDVGGVIETKSRIRVRGANITVDGFTAPAPGITVKNLGLRLSGNDGAHDVIIRGIRVHIVNNVPGQEDGIAIVAGAYNIVIDHVSVRGASDENIGINNAHDITISSSILADPLPPRSTNVLITNGANRISLHHNLFFNADRRSPWITWLEVVPSTTLPSESPDTVADVRNNLMWEVSNEESSHGVVVFGGAKANIVDNFFKATTGSSEGAQKRVIVVCNVLHITAEDMEFCGTRAEFPPARAYVANNISADPWTKYINTKGTETIPFTAPVVDTTDACSAAKLVLADAGATPRDAADQQNLSQIVLPCPAITGPPPGSVLPGSEATFAWTNNGADVTEWRLLIGTTAGAKNIYDSDPMQPSRTSRLVKKLPTNGQTIWVRLRFKIGGLTLFADYQYTAAG